MQRDPRAFLWDVRDAALAIQFIGEALSVERYPQRLAATADSG